MNKKSYKIFSAVCVIALVYNTITISSLKSEINNLYNNYNNMTNSMSNQINNVYNNVNSMLRKQADILEDSELKVISADMENLTAVIEYTAMPKVYNPALTKAEVEVNDEKFAMEYADGKYVLKVTVPLMTATALNGIYLEDNGTIRTQKLNNSITPRYEYLTTINGDMHSGGTYSHDDRTWTISGGVQINAEQKGKIVDIAKVELVQVTDGVEMLREKLEDKLYADPREEAILVAENEKTFAESGWTYDAFETDIKMTFKLAKGTTTYLYADVTDREGYVHRCVLDVWKTNADGSLADDFHFFGHGAEAREIYSPDGELVFKLDEELIEWF